MNKSRPVVRSYWLGSVPYREAWDLQRALVERVRAGGAGHTLLLLEHPHVFTMGRRGSADHLLWDQAERARRRVEVVWSDRGGDATYHGPGQLTGYPIVDLARLPSDILRYLRDLERSLVAYLAELGLDAEPGGQGLTGVWSRGPTGAPGLERAAKVAAIGVKLNQSVTSHGFALNLSTDLDYFDGIVPCGLVDRRATSVQRLGGRAPGVEACARAYAPHFSRAFGLTLEWGFADELRGLRPSQPARELEVIPLAGA